jgi:hypothetical protein
MRDVYWVGVFLGIGVGIGVALTGVFGGTRLRFALAVVLGAAIGAGLGLALAGFEDAIAGGIGGVLGAAGARQLVSGTVRRGGTRGATAMLTLLAGLVLALLAFIPVVGFLEGLAVPALGVRLRRREPSRYAGLRSLARD